MGPDKIALCVNISGALGSDEEVYITQPLPGEYRLVAAYFCPDTTSAANATNYGELQLLQGSTAVSAKQTTASTAWTAGTARAFTLSAAGASLDFGQGDVIKVAKTEGGTGIGCVGQVVVALEKTNQ